MNLRKITTVTGAIVVVVVVSVFCFQAGPIPTLENRGEASGEMVASVQSPSASSADETKLDGNQASQSADWESLRAVWSDGAELPKKFTETDCDAFIAKHGATAVNLVAAYEASRDLKWMEQALATFPDSPIVLMTALFENQAVQSEKRNEWVNRLKLAEPSNPVAWLIASDILFKEGRTAEAAAEIAAALERPGFYTYSSERISAALKLFEDRGIEPVVAECLILMQQRLPLQQIVADAGKALQSWKNADGSGQTETDEAARLQRGLGRMFQTPEAARTLISQLVGISIESKGLGTLPATEMKRRQAELDATKTEIRALTALPVEVVASRDIGLVKEYLRRMRTEGELSALRWMKGRLGK